MNQVLTLLPIMQQQTVGQETIQWTVLLKNFISGYIQMGQDYHFRLTPRMQFHKHFYLLRLGTWLIV